MLSTISINFSRSTLLIILGVIALILLIVKPKSLKVVLRWILFIPATYILLAVLKLIDIFELITGLFLSNLSWGFELALGIEDICVDTAIMTVMARLILPKTKANRWAVAIGGALLCLWNLFHYCSFSLMPMGYDPEEPHEINWIFTVIYAALYAIVCYVMLPIRKLPELDASADKVAGEKNP